MIELSSSTASKRPLAIAIVAIVIFSLFSFAGGYYFGLSTVPSLPATQPKITLKLLAAGTGGAYTDWAAAAFENQTGIHVDVVHQTWSKRMELLGTVGASNTYVFDVSDWVDDWAGTFGIGGYVIDLSNYTRADPASVAGIPNALLNDFTLSGHLYGIPYWGDEMLFLYNAKMFADAGIAGPPQTLEEMAADAAKLTNKQTGVYGLVLPWVQGEDIKCNYKAFLNDFGGSMFDTYDHPTMNSTQGVAALQYMVSLMQAGVVDPGSMTMWGDEAAKVMGAGKAAMSMVWTGHVQFANSTAYAVPGVAGNIRVALVPGEGSHTSGSVLGPEAWAILSTSPHKDEAWQFIKFLSTAQSQIQGFVRGGYIPTTMAALNSTEVTSHAAYMTDYVQQLQYSTMSCETVPNYEKVSDIMQIYIHKALTGEMSSKAALDEAAAEISGVVPVLSVPLPTPP